MGGKIGLAVLVKCLTTGSLCGKKKPWYKISWCPGEINSIVADFNLPSESGVERDIHNQPCEPSCVGSTTCYIGKLWFRNWVCWVSFSEMQTEALHDKYPI